MTKHPIHLIKAWTGHHEDETPLCGADKWAKDVWGYRTEVRKHVTCEKCHRKARKLEKQLDNVAASATDK